MMASISLVMYLHFPNVNIESMIFVYDPITMELTFVNNSYKGNSYDFMYGTHDYIICPYNSCKRISDGSENDILCTETR